MAPYLRTLSVQPPKTDLLPQLEERNAAELKTLEDKLKDAEENLGESEVSELLRAKAMYLCRIGSKVSNAVLIKLTVLGAGCPCFRDSVGEDDGTWGEDRPRPRPREDGPLQLRRPVGHCKH